MIIQSTNEPILIKFSDSLDEITKIRITLWAGVEKMKEWTMDDITIDDDVVTAPLTEDETKSFIPGNATLEIKWLDSDGKTEFAKRIAMYIEQRNDTITFGGDEE